MCFFLNSCTLDGEAQSCPLLRIAIFFLCELFLSKTQSHFQHSCQDAQQARCASEQDRWRSKLLCLCGTQGSSRHAQTLKTTVSNTFLDSRQNGFINVLQERRVHLTTCLSTGPKSECLYCCCPMCQFSCLRCSLLLSNLCKACHEMFSGQMCFFLAWQASVCPLQTDRSVPHPDSRRIAMKTGSATNRIPFWVVLFFKIENLKYPKQKHIKGGSGRGAPRSSGMEAGRTRRRQKIRRGDKLIFKGSHRGTNKQILCEPKEKNKISTWKVIRKLFFPDMPCMKRVYRDK